MSKPKKKKLKFDVYGVVTGGKYLGQVEAGSLEEAEEIVNSGKGPALDASFCCQCSKECENPEITDITLELCDG